MKTRVAIETGDKKVFATALDWPGWARSAKSREEALRTLLEYGARYKKSIGSAAAGLILPKSADDFEVIDTVHGGTNTDFGVPHEVAAPDRQAPTDAQLEVLVKLLKAAWKAFDKAAAAAHGKTLATGPRGGGRKLDQIVEHVRGAERIYVSALGAKAPPDDGAWSVTQAEFVDALHAKIRGELPERGPRGGERWPARYAIRRSAWHALDHAWEIEDRAG